MGIIYIVIVINLLLSGVDDPTSQCNVCIDPASLPLPPQSLLGALSVDRGPSRSVGGAPSSSTSSTGQPEPHGLLPLAERPVRFSLLAVPDSTPLERPPRPLPSCPARLDKVGGRRTLAQVREVDRSL